MYWWQRKLWGIWPAFVGAFLYQWAPFRFSDIFVRASLGEACTYMFLPLIFWGLSSVAEGTHDRFSKSSSRDTGHKGKDTVMGPIMNISSEGHFAASPLQVFLGALGIAGIILSHSLIFMLLVPALLLWWLVNILSDLSHLKQNLLKGLAVGVLGIGLAAFYFLPAVFLKNETVFDKIMAGSVMGFADHFPTIKQLIYSPWGYGFSFPGINDGMSFQVGIAQWLVVVSAAILLIVIAIRRSRRSNPPHDKIATLSFSRILRDQDSLAMTTGVTFLLILAFSLFMMQPASIPIWKLVNQFAYIDYPWRYLFLAVFSASVLAGFVVESLKHLKSLKLLKFLVGAFLLATALYTNRNHLGVNAWLDWPVASFVGDGDTSNSFDEYAPLLADKGYERLKKPLVEVIEGQGQTSQVKRKTNKISFSAKAQKSSVYRLNVWYFPQVKLSVDGQPAQYSYQEKGVLDFPLTEGKHKVEVKFVRTTIEQLGLLISLASAVFLFSFHSTIFSKSSGILRRT